MVTFRWWTFSVHCTFYLLTAFDKDSTEGRWQNAIHRSKYRQKVLLVHYSCSVDELKLREIFCKMFWFADMFDGLGFILPLQIFLIYGYVPVKGCTFCRWKLHNASLCIYQNKPLFLRLLLLIVRGINQIIFDIMMCFLCN